MAVQEDRSQLINTGTADGLLAFCDFVAAKGYGTTSTINALKSAARQVLSTVEGDDFGLADVRSIDVDDYLDRFETIVRGSIKAESVQSYRARFRRILDVYVKFLEDGRPPSFRSVGSRRSTESRETRETPRTDRQSKAPARAADLIDYPFPLSSGAIAYLRLPKRLDRSDAERLGAFIRTLVLEPQRELTSGGERGDGSQV